MHIAPWTKASISSSGGVWSRMYFTSSMESSGPAPPALPQAVQLGGGEVVDHLPGWKCGCPPPAPCVWPPSAPHIGDDEGIHPHPWHSAGVWKLRDLRLKGRVLQVR